MDCGLGCLSEPILTPCVHKKMNRDEVEVHQDERVQLQFLEHLHEQQFIPFPLSTKVFKAFLSRPVDIKVRTVKAIACLDGSAEYLGCNSLVVPEAGYLEESLRYIWKLSERYLPGCEHTLVIRVHALL